MAELVCSWSGGKDSALALHRAVAAGAEPRALLTMMTEGGERSRSHGLRREVLEAQAAMLDLPLAAYPTSWDDYEETFVRALQSLAEDGIAQGVFGDIDLDHHRAWVEGVCARAGIEPLHPLWQRDRRSILDELLELGFDVRLVAVRDGLLPPELLGCRLDAGLIVELETAGIDACGEGGEYHSVVVDCPLFSHALPLETGEVVLRDGVWFADARFRSRL